MGSKRVTQERSREKRRHSQNEGKHRSKNSDCTYIVIPNLTESDRNWVRPRDQVVNVERRLVHGTYGTRLSMSYLYITHSLVHLFIYLLTYLSQDNCEFKL